VDDPHRRPGDQDRANLVARIKRAADEGRIAAADRDIRLANVAGAQSMTELDLMSRDLDQLESALPAGAPPEPAWTGPGTAPVADVITEKAVDAAKSTARSIGMVTLLLIGVLALGAIGLAVFRAVDGSGKSSDPGLQDPVPISEAPTAQDPDSPDPTVASPGAPGPAYSLTASGIRRFLQAYRERFKTSEIIDLTMYGDYVVVDVPVAGKARHDGWLYRNDSGWTSFGGVTANFPGARAVDTNKLAIPALIRNIARAQRTLNVEEASMTYVIVRQYTPGDEVPSVDIHVANDFNESGYLATTLDGKVERSYAFGS
jgi:hypothetical protein